MKTQIYKKITLALMLAVVTLYSSAAKRITEIKEGQITPDQLYIVDCLLPPQVRQLGQNYTYLAPRKPAKLTAHDCALRGGEYVAYDEANFASVAKVWQKQAQTGDPVAQNYMGEISEKGIAGTADYKSAAMWYQKAADQGHSPAQLNLGNLYERGLGVAQDSIKAINLYRQAAGVTESSLELVTEKDLRDRREKEYQRTQLLKEVTNLKNELSAVNSNYLKTQDYIKSANAEMKKLQVKLQQDNQNSVVKNRIAELEGEVRALKEKNEETRMIATTLVKKIAEERGDDLAMIDDTFAINLISPEVLLTRGIRSVPILNKNATKISIMGSVNPPEQITALHLNNENITHKLTDTGIFSTDVAINQDDDTAVSIEAIKNDGSKTMERFVIVRQILEAIKPRYLSDLFTNRFRRDLGEYHALVIGNNNYKNFEDLGTAINDANDLGKVFKEKYGYKTKILNNATKFEILQTLAEYQQRLGKRDNLVVYYAGHGLIDERQNGFWIPSDAKEGDKSTWISNDAITSFMSSMSAKHIMVIADSCYSGTMSGSVIKPLPEDVAENDILFTSRVKARTVLTSGGLQPVLDSGGDGHSIFASALLDVLNENDGVMEGYRLFKALEQQVKLRSKLSGIEQIPEYSAIKHAGHEGSEFYFLPSKP